MQVTRLTDTPATTRYKAYIRHSGTEPPTDAGQGGSQAFPIPRVANSQTCPSSSSSSSRLPSPYAQSAPKRTWPGSLRGAMGNRTFGPPPVLLVFKTEYWETGGRVHAGRRLPLSGFLKLPNHAASKLIASLRT